MPRRPGIGRMLGVTMLLAALGAAAAPLALRYAVATAQLPALDVATGSLVLDRNGVLLRPFPVGDGRWRLDASLDDVDPLFVRTLLAYEDRRFYGHRGVDVRALARAAWQVASRGRIVSGGSTLTMQVARLLDGEGTRSPSGKLGQIRTALALERRLDKRQILNLYLELAPYGGNVEGVRAASLAWFGKEPRRLDAAEAALLVALPQAPEARRPDRDTAAARAARDRVLARALAARAIDAEAAEAARREPVPHRRRPFPMLAAHVADAARLAEPGRAVHRTTIDARLQASLERLATERAAALSANVSAAILVADHRTGEILASVGSAGYFDAERDGFIDMTRAVRSPGSALKPLIYGLAFELGIAHPESLVDDRPIAFAGYRPENFDREFHGTLTVRRALQLSLNVPAVQLLDAVGPARLVARMRRAGVRPALSDLSPPGLAIGLGGLGLTLTDLVTIHAAIARGGASVPLHLDPEVPPPGPPGLPVLDRRAAWYVTSILAGAPGPSRVSPGDIAFKTGTSYGYRDAWAVGYDGRHAIGVWVGRPDGAPVPGLVGVDAAAPVLIDAFARLGPRTPFPSAPGGILEASTAALPAPLRHIRSPHQRSGAAAGRPEIAFPPSGAHVDVGLRSGDAMPLVLKARGGRPPYVWFANGRPVATAAYGRDIEWMPAGPGFADLTLVDGNGASTSVSVFLE